MNIVQTDSAPSAIGPYSQAISIDRWIFTSGQIPLHPATGEMVQDTFACEVNQVLLNLREVLTEGGCRPKDIIKTTVFLTDMNNFAEFNELYAQFMEDHKPARSTIQVAALPKGARIEIEAVAIRP